MASGTISFSKPSGSRMVGYIAWSSSSNGAVSNSSKVTATVYLKKNDSVSTLGTFEGSLTIDGTTYSISKYGTWVNSYVVVGSKSKTVSHNSDGSKSIKISATLKNTGTTQAGTYTASATVALDKIPRASSVSSSASWTAGEALTVNISRHSSAFTHKVSVKVGNTEVASESSVGTGVTFSGADFNKAVINAMANQDSADTSVIVTTYSGSTQIGSAVTVKGKVTVPELNNISCVDKAYIGDVLDIAVGSGDERLSHSLKYSFGEMSGFLLGNSSSGVSDKSYQWTLSEEFYEEIPESMTGECTLTMTNYFTEDGITPIRIGKEIQKKVIFSAEGSKPAFETFSFSDTNESIQLYTGNNQILVSGYSDVKCIISQEMKAVAVNGAYMVRYIMAIGDKQVQADYSDTEDVELFIPKVSSGIISVKAVDSRGAVTEVVKETSLISYFPISIKNVGLERENMAGERTTLTMELNMFCGNFGAEDNKVKSCTYRYRKSSGEWSDDNLKSVDVDDFVYDAESNTATLNVNIIGDVSEGFALAGSYDVEVFVSDALDRASVKTLLDSGYPALYIKKTDAEADTDDEGIYQIGINCVPDESLGSGLHVEGRNITLNGMGLGVPVGAVTGWFSDVIPANWLLLDGSEISRSNYAELFAILGTTYGAGDGSTTFKLPDMRGRVGAGKSSDAAFSSLGKTGGEAAHTLTTAEIPAHTHGSAGNHSHFIPNTNGSGSGYVRLESYGSAANTNRSVYTNAAGAHTHSSVGSGSSHNNLQPYIVLNYIIKAK